VELQLAVRNAVTAVVIWSRFVNVCACFFQSA
jgi:hypothetical protein